MLAGGFPSHLAAQHATEKREGLRGGVDKFQGQQAPVTIYSMASSTAGEVPRSMAFLYDLHRLSAATSLSRCLAILSLEPRAVRVACHTPR